jgi:hypothetical protein
MAGQQVVLVDLTNNGDDDESCGDTTELDVPTTQLNPTEIESDADEDDLEESGAGEAAGQEVQSRSEVQPHHPETDDDSPPDAMLDLISNFKSPTEEEKTFLINSISREPRSMARRASSSVSRNRSRSNRQATTAASSSDDDDGGAAVVAAELEKVRLANQISALIDDQFDLNCSEEELFYTAEGHIAALQKTSTHEDMGYYVGVTESPHRRFFNEEFGHARRYNSMVLIGVHGRSEVIRAVEKELIALHWTSHLCKNIGKGGERISRINRPRFLYVCFE